jgi:hypothetical protein
MKYLLGTALQELNGSPIKGPGGEPLTFKAVCVACLVQAPDRSTEDKVAAFRLAVKIEAAADEVELEAEEVTRLKRLIGDAMPVVIVGRMFELLDQRVS